MYKRTLWRRYLCLPRWPGIQNDRRWRLKAFSIVFQRVHEMLRSSQTSVASVSGSQQNLQQHGVFSALLTHSVALHCHSLYITLAAHISQLFQSSCWACPPRVAPVTSVLQSSTFTTDGIASADHLLLGCSPLHHVEVWVGLKGIIIKNNR